MARRLWVLASMCFSLSILGCAAGGRDTTLTPTPVLYRDLLGAQCDAATPYCASGFSVGH